MNGTDGGGNSPSANGELRETKRRQPPDLERNPGRENAITGAPIIVLNTK